jgi:hypothetical protein
MRSSYIRRCKACKEIIFHGCTYTEDDEIYGDYDEGAGECKVCGEDYCYDCGDIQDGVCESCREEIEREEILVEGEITN